MTRAALVANGPVSGASPGLATLVSNAPAHLLLSALLSFGFAGAYYVDVSANGKILSVLGIVLVMGALHAALFHPGRYPLLLVAYLPFNAFYPFFGQGESVGLNMTNLLLALGGVAWISSRLSRRKRLPLGTIELLLLIFISIGLVNVVASWVMSGGPADAVTSRMEGVGSAGSVLDQAMLFKRWVLPFGLFFVVRGVMEDRKGLTHVLAAMMWCTFLVAALTWRDGIESGDRSSIEDSRVGGILLQPNSMGAFLAYYGMPFLGLFLSAKGLGRRALYLAGFLVALRASLFTFSRGAYLAFALGSSLVLLLHNPLYLVGMGGVAVSFPEMVPGSVWTRLGITSTRSEEIYDESMTSNADRSVNQRFVLWRAGVKMSRDYPVLGVGLGRFPEKIDQYTEVALSENDPRDAHNAYLLTAAELGIPAAMVMVVMLLWLAATTTVLYFRRRAREDRALPLAFLGTWAATVSSCFWGSRFSDESVIGYFWILAALIVVLHHLSRTSLDTSR